MIRRITLWAALAASAAFGIVLVNQALQLADLASRVSPGFGQGVFWTLVVLLGVGFAVPIVLFVRLPRALVPPDAEEGPAFEVHLSRIRERLGKNTLLLGRPLSTREELEDSLAVLDALAIEATRQAGSRAFVTTAVSQNGALDAVVVFGIQARLVWDVAKIYSQRPGPREMAYLYSNVLATAFIAGELDDADVSEAMEPALSAVLGSAAGLVPGLQVASSVFVNSVLSGTANAFLTLRVGVIAQEYSRAWTRQTRSGLRKKALVQAGALLGGIVASGAGKVSAAVGRGTKRALKGAAVGTGKAMTGAVAGTGKAVTGAVTGTGQRIASAGAAIRERLSSSDEEAAGDGSEQAPS